MTDIEIEKFVIEHALLYFRERAERAIKDYNDLAAKVGRPPFQTPDSAST